MSKIVLETFFQSENDFENYKQKVQFLYISIIILEFIPSKQNPSITQIVTITKIVTFTQIVTPFLVSVYALNYIAIEIFFCILIF